MKKIIYALLLVLSVAPLGAQVLPQFLFNAVMNGAETVPAITTDGLGMVTLTFREDLDKIAVSGMVTGLEGSVTAFSLHTGLPGEEGPVVFDLMPLLTGRLLAGEIDAPPGMAANLFQSRIYAEVRTSAHPDGEIRGQFVPQTDLNFSGDFTGANMVPAVNTNGTGIGVLHYPVGSREVIFIGGTRDMSGPVTGIAIYKGNPGETGQLILDTTFVVPGELVLMVLRFAWLDANFLSDCIAGKYYGVLKTAAFPDGEIRGQFSLIGYLNSFFTPNGFLTVPASNSSAFGIGLAIPNANLDSISTTVLLNGIDPDAVTIRRAPMGQNGPVVHTLVPGPAAGYYQGTFPVSQSDLRDFNENRFYIDAATDAHPGGEIRGQINSSLRKAYAFDLCGTQAVPPNNSTALGMAMVSVDQVNCYIDLKVIVDGLSGDPTDATISLGAPGQSGPLLYGIPLDAVLLQDFHGIDDPEGPQIDSGLVYMNISTPDFPDGEIRGQVGPVLSCPLVSGTDAPTTPVIALFPNPFQEALYLQVQHEQAFSGRLQIRNLLGGLQLSQPFHYAGGEESFRITVGNLPDGCYHAILVADTGRIMWSGNLVKLSN